MTINIDRRQLMAMGTFGLGALSVPASARLMHAKGFTHNVASGEPSRNSVLLWTRYVGSDGANLAVEISVDADFTAAKVVGDVSTSPMRDHIAKFVVEDLQPGRWYFFRFVAPDGTPSPVGRTRTLPDGPTSRFNLGVFSCSNLPFGYFNAYAHAAQRDDLDLLIHTGDYIYEYRGNRFRNFSVGPVEMVRPHVGDEIYSIDDYRRRYAQYKMDVDLQAAHAAAPWFVTWDDHEIDNNWASTIDEDDTPPSYFALRQQMAMQAFYEHLPLRASALPVGNAMQLYRQARFGDLLDLNLLASYRLEHEPRGGGGTENPP